MSWRTGEYADPIVPEGSAIVKIMWMKPKETTGGTPYISVMARIEEFLGEWSEGDAGLDPAGQSVFGSIWLPKEEDEHKKAMGKQQRIRAFMDAIIAGGGDIDTDYDSPVEVLEANLQACVGQQIKLAISHSKGTDEYPTKAELNFFQVRRA